MESDNKNISDISRKNADAVSFFGVDSDFVFVYKKTEKLVSAIYMVTNLFSDSEPMKWSLRKKSTDLLSLMVSYKDISEINQNDFSQKVKAKVLEVVSLFEVSSFGGLVSPMNFSILKQEFFNLVDVINKSKKDAVQNVIPSNFFAISPDNSSTFTQANTSQNLGVSVGVNSDIYTHNIDQNKPVFIDKTVTKRSNRQTVIIGLLKKKSDLTIKDVSTVISDCSEKTIQRELIALISEGVVKKTGERRWSKYSLV